LPNKQQRPSLPLDRVVLLGKLALAQKTVGLRFPNRAI
jgi:hypothetical protein